MTTALLVLAVFALVLFGGLVAVLALFWALQRRRRSRASAAAYWRSIEQQE